MKKSGKKPITKRKWFFPVVGLLAVGTVIGALEKDENVNENVSNPPAIVESDTREEEIKTTSTKSAEDTQTPEVIEKETFTPPPETQAPEPEKTKSPAPTPDPTKEPENKPTATPKQTKNTNSEGKERRSNWSSGAYLGSTESDKYHDYECRAAKKILPENEVWFFSESEAQAAGYSRCGICW